MRVDTSTAHEKALLARALSNGERLPVKYIYSIDSPQGGKKIYELNERIASDGFITMVDGKFLLFNIDSDRYIEAYANGRSGSVLSFSWWFEEGK